MAKRVKPASVPETVDPQAERLVAAEEAIAKELSKLNFTLSTWAVAWAARGRGEAPKVEPDLAAREARASGPPKPEAPKPEAPKPEAPKPVTIQAVRAAVLGYLQRFGEDTTKQLLQKFGVVKVSELKEDKYADVLAAFRLPEKK